MAPNLITIIGTTLNIIPIQIFILIISGSRLNYEFTSLGYYYLAITLFIYALLDNCDGK